MEEIPTNNLEIPESLGRVAEGLTFRQLLDAINQGSQDAAWLLTERYSPHILRVVRWSLPSAIRPKVDSQDLLQSVWATILLEPDKLRSFQDPKQFMGYVAGVAKHKVVDKYRHFSTKKKDVRLEKRQNELCGEPQNLGRNSGSSDSSPRSAEPSPSQTVMVREQWQRVLDRGSSRDKAIIDLRLQGRSYREIAASLQIDERTVQRSVTRMVAEFQE